MILTSGYNLEGYDIVSYIGYESARAVIGTGFFSSLDASVSDFFGVRSNMYEDKLDLAEKAAREQLIRKAKHMGGNAIIGIDVQYTTLTADWMGVIVGGTIVKAQEREEMKMQKNESRQICNLDYNLSVPFRILDSLFLYDTDTEKLSISLSGKSYCHDAIKGLKVRVVIETIFQETVEIPNITFGDVCVNEEKELSTEYCRIKMEYELFKMLKDVSVQVTKFVTKQDEIVEVSPAQNRRIDITKEELENVRKFYGRDAIGRIYKSDSGWVCYCGMENSEEEKVCRLCKRELNAKASAQINTDGYAETFLLEEHFDAISALKNAKAICEYLETSNYSDQYFRTTVLPEIKKYERYERMYGSMKESAIVKLKELYAHN